jgi:hypothetical protein
MHDTATPGAHSAFRVLAAIAELGDATAAAIAEHAGLGYSTVTPKLRTWENTGHAERFRTSDGRTLWRLTAAGRAACAPTDDATATAPPEPVPDVAGDATAAQAAVDDDPAADRDTADKPDAATPPRRHPGEDSTATADPGATEPARAGTPATASPEAADGRTGPSPDTTPAAPAASPDAEAPATPRDQPEHPTHPAADETPTSDADPPEPAREATSATTRRTPGAMRAAITGICQSQPERQFKVAELCKLIDAANAGTGAAKASQGAVYNACTKLAAAGTLIQTVDKPATFQLTAP